MLNEADLRSFLCALAAEINATLAFEDVVIAFAKLGDEGDPLTVARGHFADRPAYAIELEPTKDWTSLFGRDKRRLFCLSDDELHLIDDALHDIVGHDFRAFECVVRSRDDDSSLQPHYGVWWSDFVFAGGRGIFWLPHSPLGLSS